MTRGEIICFLERVSKIAHSIEKNGIDVFNILKYAHEIEENLPSDIPEIDQKIIYNIIEKIKRDLDESERIFPYHIHDIEKDEIKITTHDNSIKKLLKYIEQDLFNLYSLFYENNKRKTVDYLTDIQKTKEEFDQKIADSIKYIDEKMEAFHTKNAHYDRAALASEFSERRKELEFRRKLYFVSFVAGLGGIVALGLWFLSSLKGTSSDTQGIILTQFVSKLFLMGPIVWFTWFLAKQYANTNRLAEDYVFKATAALAYDGYEEKVQSDGEMKRELLRTAIRTFGDNPTRLLSKNECTSPLNEAIQILDVVGKVQKG